MVPLSDTTITIIASVKIVFFIYVALMLVAFLRKAHPRTMMLMTAGAIAMSYMLIAYPLQRMWWGNNGDENLILAYLTITRAGHLTRDFFYEWLPPFYPPLYFWITGTLGRFLTASTIGTAKLGIMLTLAAWLPVSYFAQSRYWRTLHDTTENILSNAWFWFLAPLLTFLLLDFEKIITKPYEALPALLTILWTILYVHALEREHWRKRTYVLFGVSAGLLFLWYYFWWIIVVPAVTILALSSRQNRTRELKRLAIVGCIMGVVTTPYTVPLITSFIQFGVENWQARYFVPGDFSSFFPWGLSSTKALLMLIGLAGLVWGAFRSRPMRAVLTVLLVAYVYQFFSIVRYLGGTYPIQASKPFLFLGTACLAVGAAYAIIAFTHWFAERSSEHIQRAVLIVVFLLLIPLFPFGSFIDDAITHRQIENDLKPVTTIVPDAIRTHVSNWERHTWLASAIPELVPYLPLSYYVSYSPHFSHQASQYSSRLAVVRTLAAAEDAEAFASTADHATPEAISALALYRDPARDVYVLFLWSDTYPNGGSDTELIIPTRLITEAYWDHFEVAENWHLWVRK